MTIDQNTAKLRVDDEATLARSKMLFQAPTENTFHLQPFLSNKDGGGGLPGELPTQVQELWGQFASCVESKTVQSEAYKEPVNHAIAERFHGEDADYMKGDIGKCVLDWLTSKSYAYTYTKTKNPLTRFSRRNNNGGWDYANPGIHFAVKNADGVIECYMGIDTTEKVN